MFEIGVGTGIQLQDILKIKNKGVRDKDQIEAYIGTKQIKRTFLISDELKKEIHDFTEGKDPDGYLFTGHPGSSEALSREQAYRALKNAGRKVGLSSIGAQTMRKTFAWRYYKETGDIWWYTAPTIIKTFIEAYDFTGKIVVFFATSGGTDVLKATTDLMEVLNGKGKVRGGILMGKPGFTDQMLQGWIDTLQLP